MNDNKPISRIMTPARIIDIPGKNYTEVVFLESAQFYKLENQITAFEEMLGLLQKAAKNKLTVEVHFSSIDSNIIEAVRLNE